MSDTETTWTDVGIWFCCPTVATVDRFLTVLARRLQHAPAEALPTLWADVDRLLDHRSNLEGRWT